jgi:hypothetical protein
MGNGAMALGPQATAPILDSTEAEVVGFNGEPHKPSYGFRYPFTCRTITYVQLSR